MTDDIKTQNHKEVRMKQITGGHSGELYGLDANGIVYYYNMGDRIWVKMETTWREENENINKN